MGVLHGSNAVLENLPRRQGEKIGRSDHREIGSSESELF